MKSTEQRLNFLKRCKQNKILPIFIDVNVTVNQKVFPRSRQSSYVQSLKNSLKAHLLVQSISQTYNDIKNLKQSIVRAKDDLKVSLPHGDTYSRILTLFEENNHNIKLSAKRRLQQKFLWLKEKHSVLIQDTRSVTAVPNVQERSQTETPANIPGPFTSALAPVPVVQSTVVQYPEHPPEENVTAIQVELTPQEQQLLELGPNFALISHLEWMKNWRAVLKSR